MSRNNGQATQRKKLPKKGSKRQIYSSNAPQARAKRGQSRAFNSNQGAPRGTFMNPVRAPTSQSTGVVSASQKIRQASKNSIIVCDKEFIGNVSGVSTAVFTQSFELALNPGISATFPRLANIAQNYQAYRFRKLIFRYFTRTGSTTVGSVILCPDYDAADSAPVSEQVLDSYEDAHEDAPWKNIECSLSPASMHLMGPKKFIRFGGLASNLDIKTYDVGNMFVYTVDSTAAASWGKIWVEYEVELFTPQLPPGGSNFSQIATIVGANTQTAAEPFGLAPVVAGNMQIVAGNNGANSTIVLSNAVIGAEYSLSIYGIGTVITGAIALMTLTGGTAVTNHSGFPAAATNCFAFETFTATASTITMVVSATATTITSCFVVLALTPTSTF